MPQAVIHNPILNTVGKAGKLGERVRCVVSVSMLTEGWDANTVTHILGIPAFGTQLLCEQVVGRGLRRMSYAVNGEGRFDPEYAEVYGVPYLLHVIVEVTVEARKDKAAKVTTARTLWVPAVNSHGGFGRWAFVEVTDPWDAQRTIRAAVSAERAGAVKA
jgi:superfamily II DNA or RNA helicase